MRWEREPHERPIVEYLHVSSQPKCSLKICQFYSSSCKRTSHFKYNRNKCCHIWSFLGVSDFGISTGAEDKVNHFSRKYTSIFLLLWTRIKLDTDLSIRNLKRPLVVNLLTQKRLTCFVNTGYLLDFGIGTRREDFDQTGFVGSSALRESRRGLQIASRSFVGAQSSSLLMTHYSNGLIKYILWAEPLVQMFTLMALWISEASNWAGLFNVAMTSFLKSPDSSELRSLIRSWK